MTDNILRLPLSSDDYGEIFDATGDNIADVWQRTCNGAPADEEDDAEAEALCKARAAEIVRRVNLFDELADALRLAFGNVDGDTHCSRYAEIDVVLAKVEGR